MADFCLPCWNRLNGTQDPPEAYVISRRLSFCEGCERFVPVILQKRKPKRALPFRFFRRRR